MKRIVNVSNKVCATCDKFVCDRKILPGRFVEMHEDDGKCFLINKVNGLTKVWCGGCHEWSPWGPLK